MLVVGDLNLTPWSPIFSGFEAACGLRRAVSNRGGFTPIWYAQMDQSRWALGLAGDHALSSVSLNCVSYHAEGQVGSDHRPLVWGFSM